MIHDEKRDNFEFRGCSLFDCAFDASYLEKISMLSRLLRQVRDQQRLSDFALGNCSKQSSDDFFFGRDKKVSHPPILIRQWSLSPVSIGVLPLPT